MQNQSYKTTIEVAVSPKNVFDHIKDVSKWWSKDYEGNSNDLNDEFIANDDLDSVEWCLRFHPSVRLSNILRRHFKTRRVSSINEMEFMLVRDAGKKSWEELVQLRGLT